MNGQNTRAPLESFHKTSKVSYFFFIFGEKIVGCTKDNCNINLFYVYLVNLKPDTL